jgi:predicted RNase H-like HicB family nuclease
LKKHKVRIHNYTVIFEADDGRGYNAAVPTLLDIQVQGKTLKEARALVTEVIECYIKELKANEPLPHKHLTEEAQNISYLTSIKY